MNAILIIMGGTIICFSWWLLLHPSDKKVHRFIRPRGIVSMSKEGDEGYREANLTLITAVNPDAGCDAAERRSGEVFGGAG